MLNCLGLSVCRTALASPSGALFSALIGRALLGDVVAGALVVVGVEVTLLGVGLVRSVVVLFQI